MSPLLRAYAVLLIAVAFAAGCAVTNRDVSGDPAFLVGYKPGQIYRLKQPARLVEIDDRHGNLVPPSAHLPPDAVIHTIPVDTRIRIVALRHVVCAAPIQWESVVETYAEFADRPGYEVFLRAISDTMLVDGDWGMKAGAWRPDPEWLELERAAD